MTSYFKHRVLSLFLPVTLVMTMMQPANAQQTLELQTDAWPPYINEAGQPAGTAANLINILLDYEGLKSEWQYMPYELSFHYIETEKKVASFPYFRTEKRAESVLYSLPVFSVTSRLYYNRQFVTEAQAEQAYKNQQRIGKVAGYSYGESIDERVLAAVSFATEEQALTALFNNDIDVLPMTEGVLNHSLDTKFPLRKQLILPIKSISDNSSLHVIAAKTPEGEVIISRVNNALKSLVAEGMTSLQSTNAERPEPVDIAKLITTEGYPLVMGQSEIGGSNIEYYSLPQGTQVLITEWSSKILQPSKTDRIYKNMMDLSKVVVLNGPHVGKELYVKNMHIELI